MLPRGGLYLTAGLGRHTFPRLGRRVYHDDRGHYVRSPLVRSLGPQRIELLDVVYDLMGRQSAKVPLGGPDLDGHEHLPQGVLVVPVSPVAVYLRPEDNDVGDRFETSLVLRTFLLSHHSEARGYHFGNLYLHVHPELPGRDFPISPQAVVEECLVVELGAEHGPALDYEAEPRPPEGLEGILARFDG